MMKIRRDQTSGFKRSYIGKIVKLKGNKFILANKWQISLDRCPWCHSRKTFHSERMKTLEKYFLRTGITYENCIESKLLCFGNTKALMKSDICLKCGRDWLFEIFCWEKVSGRRDKVKFITAKVKK